MGHYTHKCPFKQKIFSEGEYTNLHVKTTMELEKFVFIQTKQTINRNWILLYIQSTVYIFATRGCSKQFRNTLDTYNKLL